MESERQPVDTKELEARMRPRALSEGGFLGSDEHLEETIDRDAQTLRSLGIVHEEIAKELERLINRAEATPGRPIRIGNFKVTVTIYPGFQMCPWSPDIHQQQCVAGGGVSHASVDWHIRNLRTGQEMKGPGLAVHLISEHHFFQGLGSPYRTSPDAFARLLELGPYENL